MMMAVHEYGHVARGPEFLCLCDNNEDKTNGKSGEKQFSFHKHYCHSVGTSSRPSRSWFHEGTEESKSLKKKTDQCCDRKILFSIKC